MVVSTTIICLLISLEINANWVEDTKEFTESFENTFEKLVDVSQIVLNITQKSTAFWKTAGPVSSLVAFGLEKALSNGSDEFIALNQLKSDVKRGFRIIEERIETLENSITTTRLLDEYDDRVQINIHNMNRQLEIVIDPERTGPNRRAQFVSMCNDRVTGPLNTFGYLSEKLIRNCKMPTNDSEALRIEVAAEHFFIKIEKGIKDFRGFNWDEYRLTKINFMQKLEYLTYDEAFVILGSLKKEMDKASKTWRSLKSAIERTFLSKFNARLRDLETGSCLINSLYIEYKHKRDDMEKFEEIVIRDMGKLALISYVCANITNNGDPVQIMIDLNYTRDYLSNITTYMDKWILEKLKLSWPLQTWQTANETIKAEVGDDDIPLNETIYENLSEKIRAEANNRGLRGYAHNVLITPNWDKPDKIANSYCEPPDVGHARCFVVKNFQSINIFVFRYVTGLEDKASDSNIWAEENRKAIEEIMKQHVGTSNLKDITDELDEKLVITSHYGQWVALHDRAYGSTATIAVGLSTNKIYGAPSFANYSIYDGWIVHDKYTLYFFLMKCKY